MRPLKVECGGEPCLNSKNGEPYIFKIARTAKIPILCPECRAEKRRIRYKRKKKPSRCPCGVEIQQPPRGKRVYCSKCAYENHLRLMREYKRSLQSRVSRIRRETDDQGMPK